MRRIRFVVLVAVVAVGWIPLAHMDSATMARSNAFSSSEAPSGFDNLTNGNAAQASMNANRTVFEEREGIADGLGPVFNSNACSACHMNPVTGGISQVSELRAGHFDGHNFIDHPGGSLINDNAINAAIQETVLDGNEVRTFRTSLNTLGDGFVEAIANDTFTSIRNGQPAGFQ